MNTLRTLTIVGALAMTGCADCGAGNNDQTNNGQTNNSQSNNGVSSDAGTPPDVTWKVIDVSTDEPPEPCAQESAEDVPLLALEHDQTAETFISPASSATALGIDYEVVPPTAVDRVEVTFDFDPRLELDDLLYEERCLSTIPLADLRAAAENDVVSARVTAIDPEGLDSRRGRVSLSTGSTSETVVTDTIESQNQGDWYFVFEPATGINRILLAPADVSRTTFTQEGLPDLPGVVALIRTDEIRWSSAYGVAYAREGFSARWRERALEWHGRLRRRGESAETPRRLQPLIPAGATVRTSTLTGALAHDFDDASHLLLEAVGGEATLSVPCEQLPLQMVAAGLVEITEGGASTSPGDTAELDAECGGTDSVVFTIATNLLTPRRQHVVISRTEGN